MFRQKRWAAAGALAGALTIFGGSAAFAAGGWTTVSVPSPGSNTNTVLSGVFARTDADAWAVGGTFVAAGVAPAPPTIYHWNGTAWSLVSSPALGVPAGLSAVSASSATDAWAVGAQKLGRGNQATLMEHWNGTAWSVDTADTTYNQTVLRGVLDLSPVNAYATGFGSGPVLQHWNGTSWSPVTLPDARFVAGPGQDISATSASDIWLIGSSVDPATSATIAEALHFNGTAWTVVPMAQTGSSTIPQLGAVIAISPTDAWAAGDTNGQTTLIEHWNGASWSIVPSPTPGTSPGGVFLTGIAARSAADVYAVGSDSPCVNCGGEHVVILRWNGTSWSDDTSDTLIKAAGAAATFPGAAREWAIGSDGNNQALVLSHS